MTFTIIGLWRTFRRSQNLSNAASSRASCPISDVRRYSGDYVVSRKRPPNPLQLELTDWLDFDGILYGHQHTRADENLSRLCLIAEPLGDVRDRSDSGVVEAPLKANCAERGKSVRYADPEANVVAEATPFAR